MADAADSAKKAAVKAATSTLKQDVSSAWHRIQSFMPPGLTGLGFAMDMGLGIMGASGKNVLEKGFNAAVSSVAWAAQPGMMMAAQVLPMIPQIVKAGMEFRHDRQLWWNQMHRPFFGSRYTDTQPALTMRQASINAIQESRMNARSSIGMEAKRFHAYNRGVTY